MSSNSLRDYYDQQFAAIRDERAAMAAEADERGVSLRQVEAERREQESQAHVAQARAEQPWETERRARQAEAAQARADHRAQMAALDQAIAQSRTARAERDAAILAAQQQVWRRMV